MDERELESQLRAAFAVDDAPSEQVWARVRKPEPRWMPSWGELGFAVAAGAVALVWISLPRTAEVRVPVAQRPNPIERTYLASTRMSTNLPRMR